MSGRLDAKRRRTAIVVAVAVVSPAAAAGLTALVVMALGFNGTVVFHVPVATLTLFAGAAAAAVVALTVGAIWGARATRVRAHAQGVESTRAAHRRFLDRLDHEMKNPITAIRAAVQSDLDDAPSPALVVAAGQAGRLSTLVGGLRSLAVLETADIEQVPLDLAALVSEEVRAVEEDLATRGVDCTIVTQFPSAPWHLPRVSGDTDLLAIAMRNLLTNAVKYSDPPTRIEIRGYEESGSVVLDVADSGWGIAEEDLPRIWEELWRGQNIRGADGSGLGLSLVRTIVARHGGRVSVRSQIGTGTSIRLRFPAPRRN